VGGKAIRGRYKTWKRTGSLKGLRGKEKTGKETQAVRGNRETETNLFQKAKTRTKLDGEMGGGGGKRKKSLRGG